MSEKQHTAEMAAYALREAGTLMLVFGPLYQLFEPYKPSWRILSGVLGLGALFLAIGIIVEEMREP